MRRWGRCPAPRRVRLPPHPPREREHHRCQERDAHELHHGGDTGGALAERGAGRHHLRHLVQARAVPDTVEEVVHVRRAPDPRVAGAAEKARVDSNKKHWAWQPLTKPAPPEVKDPAWCKTPVDNFILARLEAKKLKPNPPADKRTLIRRATFDLIGLPPTPEEVESF